MLKVEFDVQWLVDHVADFIARHEKLASLALGGLVGAAAKRMFEPRTFEVHREWPRFVISIISAVVLGGGVAEYFEFGVAGAAAAAWFFGYGGDRFAAGLQAAVVTRLAAEASRRNGNGNGRD